MSKKVTRIQKEVNPHFKEVWKTKKPYNVLKGGRSSFKSSVVVLLLVYMLIPYLNRGEKANVVVIRKVAGTLRDSVFLKIQWALRKFHIMDQFTVVPSRLRIIHKQTGSTFYFYGQDDFEKLKSNDINDIIGVWYEEAAEFKNEEEFDQTNITFMRQKHASADIVRFFWSYNPPRNPYSWINEWSDKLKGDKNYLIHSSSYLNDELGFVTDQMQDEIDRVKENDPDYYRYLYLGEPVGLGTNVYNMSLFHKLRDIPEGDRIGYIFYAIDSGHQVSATTCLLCGLTLKGKLILLDTFYYSPKGRVKKKAPSELSKDIHEFIKNSSVRWPFPVYQQTIDSAEGALRNQYQLDYNVRWHPVNKGKKADMIDNVHTLLAQGRVYYLDNDNNKIFIEEHKKYQWQEKTSQTDDPRVVKEEDDTCDAFQYLIWDNKRVLGLKQ